MHYQAAFVDEVIFSKSDFCRNEGFRLLPPFTIDLASPAIDSDAKNNKVENHSGFRFLFWPFAFYSGCSGNEFKNIAIFGYENFPDKINVYSNFFDWHIFKITRQTILFRFP